MAISYRRLLIFLSAYAIIVPVFEFYIGAIGNILVNGVAIIVLFYALITIPQIVSNSLENDIKIRILLYFIIFYFVTISLALMSGIFFGSVNPIIRDLFEFHKPVLYLFLVIFTYCVMTQNRNFLFNAKLFKYYFLH